MNTFVLAENPRTANKAAIRRAARRAQRDLRTLDRQGLERITTAYRQAIADMSQTVADQAGSDGSVRLEVMQDILGQLRARLDLLERQKESILFEGRVESAALGVRPWTDEVAVLGTGLTQIADEALQFTEHFIAADGLQLSDRVWRVDNHARQLVADAVQQAVIQGHSASQAAQDLIARGLPVPPDIAKKMTASNARAIAERFRTDLMTGTGNPYDNALRLMRTEINRAHGEAFRAAAFEHPDVIGTRFLLSPNHPRPDICDLHASVNRFGLGKGVYPKDKSPWPAHPNTLSFEEVVFADEVTTEDREGTETRLDWLNAQPPHVQEGVLNSRKKRAALLNGLLTENQINTPWEVLKQRYLRRGIDVDALAIPIQIKGGDLRRQGIDYVLERGLNTGREHAAAVDAASGIEYFRTTSNKVNEVRFDRTQIQHLYNPKNNIDVVHNHPNSSSLSMQDLRMGTLPGVSRVTAVGHDGSVYSAESLLSIDRYTDALDDEISGLIRQHLIPLNRAGDITAPQAGIIHQHVLNQVLHQAGYVRYEVEPSERLKQILDLVDLEDIIEAVFDGYSDAG